MKSFSALQMITTEANGPVADAIEAHRALVVTDEALFNDDGDLLVSDEEAKASETACNDALRVVFAAPCTTLKEVRTKTDYLLNGKDSLQTSLYEALGGFDDGVGDLFANDGNLMTFLQSLSSAGAPAASPNPFHPLPRGVQVLRLPDFFVGASAAVADTVKLSSALSRLARKVASGATAGGLTLTADDLGAFHSLLEEVAERAQTAKQAVDELATVYAEGVR